MGFNARFFSFCKLHDIYMAQGLFVWRELCDIGPRAVCLLKWCVIRPKGCKCELHDTILAQGLFLLKSLTYTGPRAWYSAFYPNLECNNWENVSGFSLLVFCFSHRMKVQLLKDMCHYFEMKGFLFFLLKVTLDIELCVL